MAMSTLSDAYSHINYKNLEKLYWSEYGYRVSIQLSKARLKRFKNAQNVARGLDRLFAKIDFSVSEGVEWRNKSAGFNFFFREADAAARFIDANAAMIDEVVRPVAPEDIDLLRDATVLLRENYWFYNYPFCITFAGRSASESVAAADAFFHETFGDESGDPQHERDSRAYYNYGERRKLYLRDENDVILTRLSVDGEYIESVSKIVLRGECQTVDG